MPARLRCAAYVVAALSAATAPCMSQAIPSQATSAPATNAPPAPADDTRPLSPAQIALFETPHLSNVTQPETLRYAYLREGPGAFTDSVALRVRHVNADGTRDMSFDYLTGARHVGLPELDHFGGNPLLMLALDRDVADMKAALGVSETFFRNHIRESFVGSATMADTTALVNGRQVPARRITIQPFAHEERLQRIASLQAKTYSFVLADDVPGMIAEIDIDTPADTAMQAPAMSQHITFAGVEK